jgi:hypothetical protein
VGYRPHHAALGPRKFSWNLHPHSSHLKPSDARWELIHELSRCGRTITYDGPAELHISQGASQNWEGQESRRKRMEKDTWPSRKSWFFIGPAVGQHGGPELQCRIATSLHQRMQVRWETTSSQPINLVVDNRGETTKTNAAFNFTGKGYSMSPVSMCERRYHGISKLVD